LHLPADYPRPHNIIGGTDHDYSPDEHEHALPGRTGKNQVESCGSPYQGRTNNGHDGRKRRTEAQEKWRLESHDGDGNARQHALRHGYGENPVYVGNYGIGYVAKQSPSLHRGQRNNLFGFVNPSTAVAKKEEDDNQRNEGLYD